MKKKILITGCAGFIGFHLSKRLIHKYDIVGIDKLTNYYSKKLKLDRLNELLKYKNFKFFKIDLSKKNALQPIKKKKFYAVIHLAAQPGVRNSIFKPLDYINDNIISQVNLLQEFKDKNLSKFIYASSSSIYGSTKKNKFYETDPLTRPLSLYSATKQSIEQITSYYSLYYKIPSVGLRFFTCYGPWGRPDLSVTKITNDILNNKKVILLNNGKTKRDFTYIDDTVDGIIKSLNFKSKDSFHEIFNLGTGKTFSTLHLTNTIGQILKKKFKIIFKDHHPTDMRITQSNMTKSKKLLQYNPKISLKEGISRYINWHLKY